MVEALLDGGALAHVPDEEAADEVLGQVGRVAEVLLVEAVVDVGDVGEGFLLGVAEEGRGAAQQDVGDHADAPHVGGRRDRLVLDDLGRDELGRAVRLHDLLARLKLARNTCHMTIWRHLVNHYSFLPDAFVWVDPDQNPNPKRDTDSEFNSIHFGIEIKEMFKMFGSKKFKKNLFQNFQNCKKFLHPKDFRFQKF